MTKSVHRKKHPVYHLALSLISALYFYSINNKVESKFLDQNIDHNMTMSPITYSNEVEGVHVFASVFVSVYDQDNWKKMWQDFFMNPTVYDMITTGISNSGVIWENIRS